MTKLKAGVIGLGVGEQHIQGYNIHPECSTEIICDTNKEVLDEVSARYPDSKTTVDPLSVIEDPNIDIVSICSYDDAHHKQIVAALRAGKHVFVEKPLCINRSELDEIRSVHKENPSLIISSNLVLRRSPRFMDLRKRIKEGELGKLFMIEGDYNYGRLSKLTDGWRGRIPNYSVMLGGRCTHIRSYVVVNWR